MAIFKQGVRKENYFQGFLPIDIKTVINLNIMMKRIKKQQNVKSYSAK